MGKRPAPGICTYCYKFSRELTWDHVLPLSWYPSSTPSDLEKWKVPACRACNRKYGKVEEDLLIRLGLCLAPDDLKSLGISHKALRAVRQEFAKNEKDKRAREQKRVKLLANIQTVQVLPQHGVFPGFGAMPGVYYNQFHIFQMPHEWLEIYATKLVKGMSLVIDKVLLKQEQRIDLYVIDERNASEVLKMFDEFGLAYHRGLGFIIKRVIDKERLFSLHAVEIWGRLKFYVAVYPPGFSPERLVE